MDAIRRMGTWSSFDCSEGGAGRAAAQMPTAAIALPRRASESRGSARWRTTDERGRPVDPLGHQELSSAMADRRATRPIVESQEPVGCGTVVRSPTPGAAGAGPVVRVPLTPKVTRTRAVALPSHSGANRSNASEALLFRADATLVDRSRVAVRRPRGEMRERDDRSRGSRVAAVNYEPRSAENGRIRPALRAKRARWLTRCRGPQDSN
jgi:hypothetical protein